MQVKSFFSGHLITSIACVFLLFSNTVLAASDTGEHAFDHLPKHAEKLATFDLGGFQYSITNSMVAWWIVSIILVIIAQLVSRRVAIIPSKFINAVESLVEFLFNFYESIVGYNLAKKTFGFLGGTFILILFSNYAGLLPGVGTIGWMLSGEGVDPHDTFRPFLRGANADINTTAAMAFSFFFFWWYMSFKQVGPKYFFSHIFLPSGVQGVMWWAFLPIFLFVGCLEMVSFVIRSVVLTFRLYGNIFAGETLIETMAHMHVLAPLPFYFMELLVGFLQALVFTLLCAVFLNLSCSKDEAH